MSLDEQPGPEATVQNDHTRFQILSPTLIRLEYSSDGTFEDRPTFFAVNRSGSTPEYEISRGEEWLEISTQSLTLRYRWGSGPFSASNTEIILTDDDFSSDAPSFNQRIGQATDAILTGAVSVSSERAGYTGNGYLVGLTETDAKATWKLGPPPQEDEYSLVIRYTSNEINTDSATENKHTLALHADDEALQEISLPQSDEWETIQIPVELDEDATSLSVANSGSDRTGVLIDYCSLTNIGETESDADSANLGGWRRDLDGQDSSVNLFDGLLSRKGHFLLDDSDTAIKTDDWVEARNRSDMYQDGYLFGYGHDFEQGLQDLRMLTGSAPLLPRWAFGMWYSRYFPYSASDYREELIPRFQTENLPLDVLVIDTDWKAPKISGVKGAGASWSGWNWDTDLFPDPSSFMEWSNEMDLHITMNVHPSIYEQDQKFDRADDIAGGLPTGYCVGPDTVNCHVWDWGKPAHVDSYFSLHEEFDEMGVDFWWLDWLADASEVGISGLTSDTWINALYANRRRDRNNRALAFSRIGAHWQSDGLNSPGPWAEHRYTVHFTGDTHPTWEMLDFQTEFTVQEGNIGLPYVSHDIGSHTGGRLSPELYARWVQSGAFQPIFRLHSVPGGHRLPWEYTGKVSEIAARFIRLRHALIPYLYTVARESHDTGLPMTRGMYLKYPEFEAAYDHGQYLLGEDLLIAPIGEPAEREDDTDVEFGVGERLEADEATHDGGTYSVAFYSGFSGSSYVDGFSDDGASITWTVTEIEEGTFDFLVRYANHELEAGEDAQPRSLTLTIAGEQVQQLTLSPTESWHDWNVYRTSVDLPPGTTDITLEKTADDDGEVNVDFVSLVASGDELPARESPKAIPPAETEVWFPPGEWVDFFTGRRLEGPMTKQVEAPIDRMPVYAQTGAIVPMQPEMDRVGQRSVDPLKIRVFAGADGAFELYEDAGEGEEYRDGEFTQTTIEYEEDDRTKTFTVGPTRGSYPGHPTKRGYRIEIVGTEQPDQVLIGGHTLKQIDTDENMEGWQYDEDEQILVITLSSRPTGEMISLTID